jgi:hypothetical protein
MPREVNKLDMPPRRSSRPPPSRRAAPPRSERQPPRSTAGLASVVRTSDVAALLAPWIADEEDREFVARCLTTEGPSHHRVASFALLKLLAEALDAAGGAPALDLDDGLALPFRLPPHLDREADADAHYPIRLPRRALARIAPPGSREADALVDALTDGPPHHALANVAMVCLLDALLARLARRDEP